MTTIIKITSKIFFSDGSSIAYVDDGRIESVFKNEKVAKSTSKTMTSAGVEHIYNGGIKIIQMIPKKTEKQLVKQIIEELESAIKNRIPMQKLSYEVIDNEDI